MSACARTGRRWPARQLAAAAGLLLLGMLPGGARPAWAQHRPPHPVTDVPTLANGTGRPRAHPLSAKELDYYVSNYDSLVAVVGRYRLVGLAGGPTPARNAADLPRLQAAFRLELTDDGVLRATWPDWAHPARPLLLLYGPYSRGGNGTLVAHVELAHAVKQLEFLTWRRGRRLRLTALRPPAGEPARALELVRE